MADFRVPFITSPRAGDRREVAPCGSFKKAESKCCDVRTDPVILQTGEPASYKVTMTCMIQSPGISFLPLMYPYINDFLRGGLCHGSQSCFVVRCSLLFDLFRHISLCDWIRRQSGCAEVN